MKNLALVVAVSLVSMPSLHAEAGSPFYTWTTPLRDPLSDYANYETKTLAEGVTLLTDKNERGGWGVVFDDQGRVILEVKKLDQLAGHGMFIKQEDGGCQYMDIKTGLPAIAQLFDRCRPFSEGLAQVDVRAGGKREAFYIDASGKKVIAREGEDFAEGLASALGDNGKLGFIDHEGKFVIAPQFLHSKSFESGLAEVYLESYSGPHRMINRKGEWVGPEGANFTRIQNADGTDSGILLFATAKDAQTRDLVGMMDSSGKVLREPEFTGYSFRFDADGLLSLCIGGGKPGIDDEKCGGVNRTGKVVIPFVLGRKAPNTISPKCLPKAGVCVVKEGEKQGLIDSTTHETLVKPRYASLEALFESGCADREICLVGRHNNVFSLLDSRGRLVAVAPASTTVIEAMSDKYLSIKVSIDGVDSYSLMDRQGQLTSLPIGGWFRRVSDEVSHLSPQGLAIAYDRSKDADYLSVGLVNPAGRWVVEPEFRWIQPLHTVVKPPAASEFSLPAEALDEYYFVLKDAQWGVIRVNWDNGYTPSGI